MDEERYNFRVTENKWQEYWEKKSIFRTIPNKDGSTDSPKYYSLEMFPYPSGNIHIGHARNYSIGDVVARYKRANGYNVLHPIGWDAFGLPAENAAYAHSIHPAEWTEKNIQTMRSQMKSLGLSFDWDREICTCKPEYYEHQQRLFLLMLENDIAYRKESVVNWDPVDCTVLANEQVVDGKGWRSGATVEQKELTQWFLRITDYADSLLDGIETLDEWPEHVRIMQKNWIGKSHGASIDFYLRTADKPSSSYDTLEEIVKKIETITVYTTRPDTIFGASFCAISPHHPLAKELYLANPIIKDEVDKFSQSYIETEEKKGIDTGLLVEHTFLENQLIPVYIANFVLMEYGTGAIFGCPAHDQRDMDFALRYNLQIIPVVQPFTTEDSLANPTYSKVAFVGEGIMVNSCFLDGMTSLQAKHEIIERITQQKKGKREVKYRLQDWGISRQRYWGCPIPVIHCKKCGIVPVPDDELPVILPENVDFNVPGNPLDRHSEWKHVQCPSCSNAAIRETDTMDTFVDSSWYYLRFCSPHNSKLTDIEEAKHFMPIDKYIGGVEHAILHLLYSRFISRFISEYLSNNQLPKEPFRSLFTQGMVLHETFTLADGTYLFPHEVVHTSSGLKHINTDNPVMIEPAIKMSKSKKNVIDQTEAITQYGADTVRWFILSDSPPEKDIIWTESGVHGAWKFMNKIWRFAMSLLNHPIQQATMDTVDNEVKINEILEMQNDAIFNISNHIEKLRMNTMVAGVYSFFNYLTSINITNRQELFAVRDAFLILIKLMNPAAPHITEEIWEKFSNKTPLSQTMWPQYDKYFKKQQKICIPVQINGKRRFEISYECHLSDDEVKALISCHELTSKYTQDKPVKKIIFVPGKIANVIL